MSAPAFNDHPNYLSEACHHGLCYRCRKCCEICGTKCTCDCHEKKERVPKMPPDIEKRVPEAEKQPVEAASK